MTFTITPETVVITVMPRLLPIRDSWQGFLDANEDDDNAVVQVDLQRQGWHIGGGGASPWFAVVLDDGRAIDRLKDAEGDQRAKITAENCDDEAACAPIIAHADLIEEVINTMLAPR